MEELLNKYAEFSATDRVELAAKTKGRMIEFDKLAQEVNLYASSRVSAGIDQLVEAWNDWVRFGDDREHDQARQDARARYRAMFALMQAEVGPREVEATKVDE